MQIEHRLKCARCGTHTTLEIFDSNLKEIRFYPQPHLSEDRTKYANLRMKRIPGEEEPRKYDEIMLCPVYGNKKICLCSIGVEHIREMIEHVHQSWQTDE